MHHAPLVLTLWHTLSVSTVQLLNLAIYTKCENNADARRSALRHCRRGFLAMDSPHIPGHVEQSVLLGRRPQSLRMPPPPYFLRAKVHCSIPTEAVIVGCEQSAQRCPVSRPLLEELGHEVPFPRWVLTGNVRWRAIRFELGRGGKFEMVGAQKL